MYIHVFASTAQWLGHWPAMAEVVGSSPVIGKDIPHFLFSFGIFNVQTDLCKMKLTGSMVTSCLIQRRIV